MGMYNSSRAAMGQNAIQPQPSWAQQQQAQQPMQQMGGTINMAAPQGINKTNIQGGTPSAPLRAGMANSLTRPSQTANLRENYAASNPYYQPQPQVQNPGVASFDEIQAEMARKNVGVQLNANPANSAMAGYMFG